MERMIAAPAKIMIGQARAPKRNVNSRAEAPIEVTAPTHAAFHEETAAATTKIAQTAHAPAAETSIANPVAMISSAIAMATPCHATLWRISSVMSETLTHGWAPLFAVPVAGSAGCVPGRCGGYRVFSILVR